MGIEENTRIYWTERLHLSLFDICLHGADIAVNFVFSYARVYCGLKLTKNQSLTLEMK